jgi:hypothetical protein
MQSWPCSSVHNLSDAILYTVVYADLFDYPLTAQEIHRYLTCYRAPLPAVEECLERQGNLGGRLVTVPPFVCLAGREELVDLRNERSAYCQGLWPYALRYGQIIAGLPFVRSVAVTGSLAMNNVSRVNDDVDYLIIACPGRVWLARALAILVVRLARQQGIELCPNFVVSEGQLRLPRPSLFLAHELAQMMPVDDGRVYRQLLDSNGWLLDYLPNAVYQAAQNRAVGRGAARVQLFVEAGLGGRLGDAAERWEFQRKIPRFFEEAAARGAEGALFTPDLCKGHLDDHAALVEQRYRGRLALQGL